MTAGGNGHGGLSYGFKKTCLIFIVSLQLVLGLVVVAACIWAYADPNRSVGEIRHVLDTGIFNGIVQTSIIIGGMILGQCITGYIGTCRNNGGTLNVYAWSICIQLCVLFGAGIAAIVLQAEIEIRVVDGLTETLTKQYASNTEVTRSWDKIQSEFECCGIKGSKDDLSSTTTWYAWRSATHYNSNTERVPASCCVKSGGSYTNVTECQGVTQSIAGSPPDNVPPVTATNPHLHMGGCYTVVRDAINSKALMLGIGAILLVLVLILAVVLACSLRKEMNSESCSRSQHAMSEQAKRPT